MGIRLASLVLASSPVELYRASADDLPAIIELLVDDPLGRAREAAGAEEAHAYRAAFDAIDRDDAHILVAAKHGAQVVGTMQLSFIPGLSRRGALRAQIESVRVRADFRGQGLGAGLFEWAIAEARERGCALMQLTTDKSRPDAHRFYHRLGFVDSHEGFKLAL